MILTRVFIPSVKAVAKASRSESVLYSEKLIRTVQSASCGVSPKPRRVEDIFFACAEHAEPAEMQMPLPER